ncbi:hypothetical protein ACHAW5_010225 [Stephanodiscus triporus]|uniref:Amine oxidase domain-containing protein n=1 Tax=Stephanodiscus triporus TaxID=2934178 RepID=A0ABD3NPJ5_9STRA
MPAAAAAARNKTVAIIGCGIAGAAAARTLSEYDDPPMTIHVFDQGRGGVGGRASSRSATTRERTRTRTPMGTSTVVDDGGGEGDHDENDDDANDSGDEKTTTTMMWDHGCQFFRADTPKFRHMVEGWIEMGHVREWNGNFASFPPTMSSDLEFFGLPSNPPFYVGADGMQSVVRGMLDDAARRGRMRRSSGSSSSTLRVYEGTRVARLERAGERWRLHGTSGIAAYPRGRRATGIRI